MISNLLIFLLLKDTYSIIKMFLDQIFKDSKTVKAVDIFMNFEKGRAEMITLCKKAAAKGIIIECDEKNKTYTRK